MRGGSSTQASDEPSAADDDVSEGGSGTQDSDGMVTSSTEQHMPGHPTADQDLTAAQQLEQQQQQQQGAAPGQAETDPRPAAEGSGVELDQQSGQHLSHTRHGPYHHHDEDTSYVMEDAAAAASAAAHYARRGQQQQQQQQPLEHVAMLQQHQSEPHPEVSDSLSSLGADSLSDMQGDAVAEDHRGDLTEQLAVDQHSNEATRQLDHEAISWLPQPGRASGKEDEAEVDSAAAAAVQQGDVLQQHGQEEVVPLQQQQQAEEEEEAVEHGSVAAGEEQLQEPTEGLAEGDEELQQQGVTDAQVEVHMPQPQLPARDNGGDADIHQADAAQAGSTDADTETDGSQQASAVPLDDDVGAAATGTGANTDAGADAEAGADGSAVTDTDATGSTAEPNLPDGEWKAGPLQQTTAPTAAMEAGEAAVTSEVEADTPVVGQPPGHESAPSKEPSATLNSDTASTSSVAPSLLLNMDDTGTLPGHSR
jgi:hypothetical protein